LTKKETNLIKRDLFNFKRKVMKKTLLKKQDLSARLTSYAASTGALLALGSAANGQVVYSGIQNIEVNMPTDYQEIDMDGDLVNDFGFYIYGSSTQFTTGPYHVMYAIGYAMMINPKTDSYNNSWITRLTAIPSYYTYSGTPYTYYNYYSIVNGLNGGVQVDAAQTMWSNITYPNTQGMLGFGYLVSVTGGTSYAYGISYGDFFGQEKFIGVRFYIGTDQHYGWIRVSLGDMIDPLTIIDWAYESTTGDSIITGVGDIIGPEVTLNAGVTTTDQQTIVLSISFGERSHNFDLSDLLITNGSPTNPMELVPGFEYSVEITADAEGEVSVVLPAGSINDLAGNGNELTSTSWTYALPVALDNNKTSGVLIYPNPANSTLHVELDKQSTIQICDMNGRVVYAQDQLLDETIDVSGFNPGIYIVRINNNEKVTQHKVVIE
jgi:hypothetical protein